jgi:NitT/TauT family transport system permease protein
MLILASPGETVAALWAIFSARNGWDTIVLTLERGLIGFCTAVALATPLGLAAGRLALLSAFLRPGIIVLMGTPPIAWIVLTLIWFGSGGAGPIVTVAASLAPGIFLNAWQAAQVADEDLLEMARLFGVPHGRVIGRIYLPHALSFLVPAYTAGLGACWKVAVMAETLGARDGVGARLADARANLDMASALGWILAIVLMVFLCDFLLARLFRRLLTPWETVSADPLAAEPSCSGRSEGP